MSQLDKSEGLNLPKSTLSEFFEDLEGKLALLTGLVDYESFGLSLEDIRKPMLVIGKPGIGKTCGIISAIRKINSNPDLPEGHKLGFKKILLGQTVVGSLSGIPVAMPDGRVVRIQIPDLPDPKRDGEYGVLFLDEVTTADEMQIQPALGLADDSRCLGEYTLPEHWIVVAAGNGPDCTNFVRLDDMTISRFNAYDIAYNYKSDFRPYAHQTGLSEDIIAFLNFSPDTCVRVESSDMDSAGKMFPCPRTWERLSVELKMRAAMNRPVSWSQLGNFSGRIIGVNAGREFQAFMKYKQDNTYSIDKILDGTEREPEVGMPTQTFHIILQGIIKALEVELRENGDGNGNFTASVFEKCSNSVRWLLSFTELNNQIEAIYELKNEVPNLSLVLLDQDFSAMCPEFDEFILEHADLLLQNNNYFSNNGL